MAYVLGFFMADGYISVNPRGSCYFSIQICDKGLLETIRSVMNSNHKISLRKGSKNLKDKYRLQIGSFEIVADLSKLDVRQNKTRNLDLPRIPDVHFGHFVRGYFDGDGNVWTGLHHKSRKKTLLVIQTVFTSCSGDFLRDLRLRLHKNGLGMGSLRFIGTAHRLQYSIKDSIMLYRIMYSQDCKELKLDRKKRVFERYMRMRP